MGGPEYAELPCHDALVVLEEPGSAAPLSLRKLLRYAGPGLLMAIAYVDPGNLESDLQTGAITGYTLLWLLGATTVMGFIVQMQAARLGVVTGRNLAELCRAQYPRPASLLLWIMAEVAIIGSDVQEVIGSAIALSILSKGALPLWTAALISAAASFVLLLVERAGVRQLEAVFAAFITVMIMSFGYLFLVAHVPLAEVARGFLVPQLPKAALPTAVALFGSLIMPHNIYLHSALVQSRGLSGATSAVKKDALVYFGIESGLSLLAALFINMFVVCVFASGFHSAGEIPDIGLRNAGEYLGATYGPLLAIVWGLGLLAAGQSSTMTGTYTGQFVMSGFLDLKVSPWARISITRLVALAPTLAVTLIMDPHSTKLDQLNQGLNLLQSIQLPFALIPVLTFTGSQKVMGCLATKGPLLIAAWLVALCVMIVNMVAVAQVTTAWAEVMSDDSLGAWVVPTCLVIAGVCYFGFLLFLVLSSPAGSFLRSRSTPGADAATAATTTAEAVSCSSSEAEPLLVPSGCDHMLQRSKSVTQETHLVRYSSDGLYKVLPSDVSVRQAYESGFATDASQQAAGCVQHSPDSNGSLKQPLLSRASNQQGER